MYSSSNMFHLNVIDSDLLISVLNLASLICVLAGEMVCLESVAVADLFQIMQIFRRVLLKHFKNYLGVLTFTFGTWSRPPRSHKFVVCVCFRVQLPAARPTLPEAQSG